MINQKNRIQWHKNTLIEKSGYVLYYMNSLKNHLSTEDRQTLYMISKFFTDGVESSRDNIHLAEYFFAIGEYYQKKVAVESVLLSKLIMNSYDRAKSYYYFKIKNYDKALQRIINTLEINKSLKNEFPILIFDSISHYKNYLKVMISDEKIEEANYILYEILNFLLSGNTKLDSLKGCFSVISDEGFYEFRQFFLNDFIFNYLFLSNDFDIARNKFILEFNNNKEYLFKYKPIHDFLEIYSSEEMNLEKINSFNLNNEKYFNSIPCQILKEGQLIK